MCINHILQKRQSYKKVHFYLMICFVFLFTGCNDNPKEDCAAVLCASQYLAIELVDIEGTNLIANGTYSLEDIKVLKDNVQVNEFPNPSGALIIIFISGTEGANTYQVSLGDTETNTLVLTLLQNNPGGECCSPLFTITDATYNGQSSEIIKEESQMEKIIVLK